MKRCLPTRLRSTLPLSLSLSLPLSVPASHGRALRLKPNPKICYNGNLAIHIVMRTTCVPREDVNDAVYSQGTKCDDDLHLIEQDIEIHLFTYLQTHSPSLPPPSLPPSQPGLFIQERSDPVLAPTSPQPQNILSPTIPLFRQKHLFVEI